MAFSPLNIDGAVGRNQPFGFPESGQDFRVEGI
jgi:hypothetical protein